jgi:hypothetical protein
MTRFKIYYFTPKTRLRFVIRLAIRLGHKQKLIELFK